MSQFEDIEINVEQEEIELIIRAYVNQHCQPASISMFESTLLKAKETGRDMTAIETATFSAIFNEFVLQSLIEFIDKHDAEEAKAKTDQAQMKLELD